MRPLRNATFVTGLVGFFGNARGQDAAVPRPGEWSPPRYQECKAIRTSGELPSPTQLLDSETAAAMIQADSGLRGGTLFSVRFDSAGHLLRFAAIESTLSPAAIKSLQRILASLVNDQPAGRPLAVRLRVESKGGVQTTVERSEWCEAHFRNLEEHQRMLDRLVNTSGLRGSDGGAVIRVIIDADGRVTTADVLRVTGSNVLIPPLAQRVILATKYNPALDDRIAVMSVDTVSADIHHTSGGKGDAFGRPVYDQYVLELKKIH